MFKNKSLLIKALTLLNYKLMPFEFLCLLSSVTLNLYLYNLGAQFLNIPKGGTVYLCLIFCFLMKKC